MTIASLLLVSALIVSFLPTQEKTQAYVNPSTEVIGLDKVISDYAVMDEDETSVSADDGTAVYMAFPLLEEVTVTDYNLSKHVYYSINYDGMTGAYAVPVFKMGTKTVNVDGQNAKYVALMKYVGYNNDYNPDSIDLTKSVCYNSKPASELTDYYERGEGDEIMYCVEEYDEYEDKLGNTYDILHIKKQTVNYDPSDEEQADWANNHPDPMADDWIGHFGAKAGAEKYVDNLCFTRSSIDYICDEAFMNAKVKTLSIPTELYDLGNRTFKDCSNLTTVRVGNKVKTVGRECFAGCVNLNSLNIDDCSYLDTIGDGAFANCAFTSLALPNNPDLRIGAGAFYGCYNFNDSVDSGESIFRRYAGTGGSNVVYIGHYAFANCTSLTDMYMYRNLKSIAAGGSEDDSYEGMFAGCTNLAHVVLPSEYGKSSYDEGSVKRLGQYMFQKCGNLEYVRFPEAHNSAPFDDWQFVTSSTLDYAMEANSAYKAPTVADSFVIWGENPYPTVTRETASHVTAKKYSNTYMYYDESGEKVYELALGDYMFNFSNGVINSIEPMSSAKSSLTIPTVIGDQEITKIAANAFVKNSEYAGKLEKLTIPDTVTSIGNNAFSGIKNLKTVYIDTKGVEVGAQAFSDNPKLQYVRFGETEEGGATTIGTKCFYNCPQLLEVDFRDDSYDSDAIYDVNVTSIGTDAFKTNRQSSFTDQELYAAGLNRLGSTSRSVSGLWLVMKGSIAESYVPYRFALNLGGSGEEAALNTPVIAYTDEGIVEGTLENLGLLPVKAYAAVSGTNKVSTKYNSYITYASGNPDNVSIRYNEDPNKGATGSSLLTYPTNNTMIGKRDDGSDVYISDIVKKNLNNEELQETEVDILAKLKNIVVPVGVDNIDQAINTADSKAEYMSHIYGTVNDVEDGVNTITLNVTNLPDDEGIFEDDKYLTNIFFNKDLKKIGQTPFIGCKKLSNVSFNAEGDYDSATPEDPYYWCENGIVYSYDGKDVTLVEVLQGRGALSDIPDKEINTSNDPSLSKVTKIAESAFKNCENITDVDLSGATELEIIPRNCFYGCSNLDYIALPPSVNYIESGAFMNCRERLKVKIPGKKVHINRTAFEGTKDPKIITYYDSAARIFADDYNIDYELLDDMYEVIFMDYDGTILKTENVNKGEDAKPPEPPKREGYKFDKWLPDYTNITQDTICVAQYVEDKGSTTSTSSSSSSSSSSTKKSSSGSSKKGGGESSSKSSSSTKSSSGSSSSGKSGSSSSSSSTSVINSSTVPIVISGYASAPAANPVDVGTGSPATGNATPAGTVPGGRTSVISTANGITDVGKMSANVNGSSDNYIVKISETPEADQAALTALGAEFGSLANIRYLPIDISLYDSTGTYKISPVPDGVTVSITMPIPDDLAIYGGNNKIASTESGVLDKMTPRFTVINSVPCMTFTASHFSPYVIYVDTANLAATGTLDQTPKTGDMIHPKWFLVIGLVAAALFMFLKRDNEEALAAV